MSRRSKASIDISDIPTRIKNSDILVSIDEISAYVNCAPETIRRYIRDKKFPAIIYQSKPGNPYVTLKSFVDIWLIKNNFHLVDNA